MGTSRYMIMVPLSDFRGCSTCARQVVQAFPISGARAIYARMNAMRLVACAAAVFTIFTFQVIAADVPNVIGTWTIVSKKPSTDSEGTRELLADRASLSIKIVRQDREAF